MNWLVPLTALNCDLIMEVLRKKGEYSQKLLYTAKRFLGARGGSEVRLIVRFRCQEGLQ